MKTRAVLLLCGVSLALVTAAAAEPATPAPPAGNAAEGLPPARILAIVRANGFDPMGAPVRKGDVYAVRALDPDDIVYRIVLDARTGRTVSMREVATPGPFEAITNFNRKDFPVFGRIFAPPTDNHGYGSARPPHAVPSVQPSQSPQAQPQPSQRSAEAAPLPRPRPYVMEATGSIPIAPGGAQPQKTPAPPKGNGAAAMPPVAPLD